MEQEQFRITGDGALNKWCKDAGGGTVSRTQAEGPPLNRRRGLFEL